MMNKIGDFLLSLAAWLFVLNLIVLWLILVHQWVNSGSAKPITHIQIPVEKLYR